jgi:MoaA/NifB/PqqE/SkfB family radical SAM enzyme
MVKALVPKPVLYVVHSYYKQQSTRFNPVHFRSNEMPLPKYLSLAFTLRCRAVCPHCYLLQENKNLFKSNEQVNGSLLRSIFRSPSGQTIKSLSCGGGEALLHPDFFELLDIPIAAGVKHIQVVTNGMSLMDDDITQRIIKEHKKLNNIQISMDATNHDDYVKTKGIKNCNFKGLCNNIKKITAATRENLKLAVVISFVINPENISKVPSMVDFATNLGADECQFLNIHVVKSDESGHVSYGKDFLHTEYKQLMESADYDINISIQPPLVEEYLDYYCKSLESLLFVSPSGKLSPCSHIPWNKEYGSLQDNRENPQDIPKSREMKKQFIDAFQKKDSNLLPEVCKFCNKRAKGLFKFDSEQKKWHFFYLH